MAVYFITDGEYVKIGKADNPFQRLKDLQVSNVKILKIICLIPGGSEMEQRLHRYFSDCKIRGEWFTTNDFMLEFIDMMNKMFSDYNPGIEDYRQEIENGTFYKPHSKRWLNSEDRERIIEMHKEGVSVTNIASDIFGYRGGDGFYQTKEVVKEYIEQSNNQSLSIH